MADLAKKNETELSQSMVETLSVRILKGITTEEFVAFNDALKTYEQKVKEKNMDPEVHISLTSLRNSIPRSILEIFTIREWVTDDTIEAFTENHLSECIKKYSKLQPDDYDLELIEQLIKIIQLRTPTNKLMRRSLRARGGQRIEQVVVMAASVGRIG